MRIAFDMQPAVILFALNILAIANAIPARDGQFAYVVSIQNDTKHFCTGIIIHPTTILTSAICFPEPLQDEHNMTIVAGVANISLSAAPGGQRMRIMALIKHPFYDESYSELHALALLKLEAPLLIDNKFIKNAYMTRLNGLNGAPLATMDWWNDDVLSWQHMRSNDLDAQTWTFIAKIADEEHGRCEGDFGAPLVDPDHGVVGMRQSQDCDDKSIKFTEIGKYTQWMFTVSFGFGECNGHRGCRPLPPLPPRRQF